MTVTPILPSNWRDQALCAEVGSETFFVDDVDSQEALRQANEKYPAARRICRECPVREQCLETEMRIEGSKHATHRFGIFGGLSPYQRHQLYKDNPGRWPGYIEEHQADENELSEAS